MDSSSSSIILIFEDEGFHHQNVPVLFFFSIKQSYLLTAKVTPDANNSLQDGSLGIQNIAILLEKSINSYTQIEHSITSQKIT